MLWLLRRVPAHRHKAAAVPRFTAIQLARAKAVFLLRTVWSRN